MFDKTGTITEGKPTVVETRLFRVNDSYWTLRRLLAVAGTAESGSEHPLGMAIRKHCKEYFGYDQLGRCEEFKAVWGYGLSAKVHGIDSLMIHEQNGSGDGAILIDQSYNVLIGNREWMEKNNIHVDDDVDQSMTKHEHDGHTAVLIAIDGKRVYLNYQENLLNRIVSYLYCRIYYCYDCHS